MNKAIFLDRDGTIAWDVNYCRRCDDFSFLPNAKEGIKLFNQHGFKVVVITNQSGIARGYFTQNALAAIHDKMTGELEQYGAYVDSIYYCPHHPDAGCECRKPKPKLAQDAINDLDIDVGQSYVIGDRLMDIQLAQAIGCRSILIDNERGRDELPDPNLPDYIALDLIDAAKWVLSTVSHRLKVTA